MEASKSITPCYLCSQGIKLFRWRLERIPRAGQLPFTYGVHSFYSSDRTARRPKRLEPQHRPRESFHCSMVLLHDIIEILTVADNDGRLLSCIVVRNRCRVRTTLIDRDFLWQSLGTDGLP